MTLQRIPLSPDGPDDGGSGIGLSPVVRLQNAIEADVCDVRDLVRYLSAALNEARRIEQRQKAIAGLTEQVFTRRAA